MPAEASWKTKSAPAKLTDHRSIRGINRADTSGTVCILEGEHSENGVTV
jgi:hypothetical protein